jgi:hypothetical protein
VSRGLGPKQRDLIRWADRYFGVPVAYLDEILCVTGRRRRKVVQSCVDRGLVVVVNDPYTGQRRVFTPAAHKRWLWEQALADEGRAKAKLWAGMRTAPRLGPAR